MKYSFLEDKLEKIDEQKEKLIILILIPGYNNWEHFGISNFRFSPYIYI